MSARRLTPILLAFMVLLVLPCAASATTFTVTSVGDADDAVCDVSHCSLREALNAANGLPGTDTIEFSILPGGQQAISVLSALPHITDPVVVAGETQDGYAGAPLIELDRAVGTSTTMTGLLVDAGGAGSVIRSLSIGGFQFGVHLAAASSLQSSYIGLRPGGETTKGNSSTGVRVTGAGVVVGGPTAAQGNVISGNGIWGVLADGNGTVYQGNRIGTNASGTTAKGNAVGIRVAGPATANMIGGDATSGTGTAPGNLISGNGTGISMDTFAGVSGTTIRGNLIGTNAAGTGAVPNSTGIHLNTTNTGTTIGGTSPSQRNVISGNSGTGVQVGSGSSSTTIAGNAIGVDAIGGALGNGGAGVRSAASGVTIGANAIVANGGGGVVVQATALDNDITSNAIRDNTGPGISLEGDAPGADGDDADGGGNEGQNAPGITEVSAVGGVARIRGTLDAENPPESGSYRVEVFKGPACDPSGAGEGAQHVATLNVLPDADGDAVFDEQGTVTAAPGEVVTATVRDPSGDTSEFSACKTVVGGADVGVTQSAPATPYVGEDLVYDVTVTNHDPATPTDVTLVDTLPAGVTFVSAPDCTQAGGVVTCPLGTMQPGTSRARQITVRPTSTGSIENAVTVTSLLADPTGNNTSVLTRSVTSAPAQPPPTVTDPSPAVDDPASTATTTSTSSGRDATQAQQPPAAEQPSAGGQPSAGEQSASAGGPLPPPVTRKAVNLEPLRGIVTVTLPDGRTINIRDAEQIPMGSVVDTRRGAVRLTSTGSRGRLQSATFSDGLFRVTQSPGADPYTDLTLVEDVGLSSCPRKGTARGAARRRIRRLWGDGRGRYRTRARRSATIVTGTKWLVEDSCAGTLTRVSRGSVQVRDYGRRRTVPVKAGKRYLAR